MTTLRLTRWHPQPAVQLVRRRSDAWLGASADLAAADACDRAPVRTGRLRRSIVALPLRRPDGRARSGVWARAPYALWVEIGTRRMRAQPYLRPALDAVRGAANTLVALARIGVN